MNATLVRTGYSPNIKERRDCSCALFDAAGEMISQAETMPVHLGAMPFSVAAAVKRFPPAELEPGDSVLLNDPFRGGAHLPDLTLVSPVFVDGDVVAYAANRAHHADIGGSRAGSVAADSTEIYQEGLRIPPVKFASRGTVDEDVLSMILANVRTPDERRGDLRAQEAANATGRRRFSALAEKYGDTLAPALAEIKDYSERRMRAEIESLPDGTYTFEDVLDDDGKGNEDLPVRAAVTVDDDEVHVDFAGTAPQTAGPINAVFAVTASATYYAVRCVTDPSIPPNHGCYRPITVETPERSLVDPEPPAAVVGGNLETSQRVTDVVLGAFAEADVSRVLAGSQGTMNNVTFGGTDPRRAAGDDGAAETVGSPYAFYETQGGGFGGRDGKDGMDGVHVHMSNTRNTPVEVLETAYPLRVERYELRPDSGGAGRFRGGLGLRRDIAVRGHTATFSLLADRQRHAPYGLAGGADGEPGVASRIDADAGPDDGDDGVRIPGKSTHDLPPGTTVSLRTPGAGGYGAPREREPAALADDLRQGKVTESAARASYGDDLVDAARELLAADD
ncbi:hydantoinase B/oxoprolinase family protein [Salinigranum marinum]|uniref:hydantoinase B/oxoprolinase family protein n=1 Tax=Salinigranum marinum TaxID=1515595 RepID=UPI0029899F0F|nr:hydantoinase B/oxoprolinase family protein [Salinigranum marinum]